MINLNTHARPFPAAVQIFTLILILLVSNHFTAGEERTLSTTNTTRKRLNNNPFFVERTVDQQPAPGDQIGFSSHEDDSTSSTISQTQLGWIIPTAIGSASFIASSLVIYIIIGIRRSNIHHLAGTSICCFGASPALSLAPPSSVLPLDTSPVATADTYHRTMLCLCISDMITSLSIALTTIPMPKDVHNIYSFDGKSYGSPATCELQAFSYVMGSQLSFCASCFLTLYYLLTIRYQISRRIMTKYIEPCGLLVSLSLSVIYPVDKLRKEMFNPLPFISWCAEGDFPFGCTTDESVDCIRGQKSTSPQFLFLLPVILGTTFQIMSFALITNTVYKREKDRHNFADPVTGNRAAEETRASHTNYNETKATATQCFMYSLAFAFTYLFLPQISAISGSSSTVLQVMPLIARPMQGLLNAIIFIYDKVCILRVAEDWSITFSEALATTIRNPASIPGVVIIFEDEEMHPFNSAFNSQRHNRLLIQTLLMKKGLLGKNEISNDSCSMVDSVNSGVMSKVNSAIEDSLPSMNSKWGRELYPISEVIL